MNQDPIEIRLRELGWRRELTDAERTQLRAWLARHPDAQADWEMEEQLSALLNRLSDAPVSSNFTARVMQAAEHEAVSMEREAAKRSAWFLQTLLPRVAIAVVLVSAGLFVFQRYEATQRAEIARSLVAVSQVESLPSAAFLEDFEAIRRLGRKSPVDEELLALMQ